MPFSHITLPQHTEVQLQAFIMGAKKGGVFLLHGTSEYNRLETAKSLSKYFLCVGTADATCPCRNCRIHSEGHPDLRVLDPSTSGNFLVADIEESVEYLSEYSLVSDKRCLVVNSVEKLTDAAEASLLKSLESVEDGVLVILTCTDRRKVRDTVVSRSKCYFTGDSSHKRNFPVLTRIKGVTVKRADALSHISPFVSTNMGLDPDGSAEVFKAVPKLIQYMLSGDPDKALGTLREFKRDQGAERLRTLVEMTVASLTDFLKVSFKASSKVSVPSWIDWYVKRSESYSEEILNKAINAFSKALSCDPDLLNEKTVWAVCLVSLIAKKEPA